MISKEMILGATSALIFFMLAYFFFELLRLMASPFNWVSGFLG